MCVCSTLLLTRIRKVPLSQIFVVSHIHDTTQNVGYIQNFPNFLSFLVIFCFSFYKYVLLVNCTLPFSKSHQMPISDIFFQIFTWYLRPLRSKLSRVSQVQVYTVFCFVSVCILTMKVISAPLMFSWCITCINSSLTWYKYLIYLLELVNQ